AGVIGFQQLIPIRTPNHFDHVPASALEGSLEFLDDFSVSANWTVESLQVAIDDPDQIVQVFASGQSECAECFRFVRFAITNESPYFGLISISELPCAEITIEPRLINREQRPEPHADGWELPEIRH